MIHRIKPSLFFGVGTGPATRTEGHNRAVGMSPNELKIHKYHMLVTDAERVLYLFRSVVRALCVSKRGSAAPTKGPVND
jgi:hypothetical protein